ncbi:hypothetical protein EDB80DRAFT_870031 [Ilyonectria destructans]|nr:hypothetical protein EDB80DRAFT_870031 [Ilyonectria destructans]
MRRGSATGRQLPVPVYASGTNSITNRSIVNGSVHRELQDQDPAARKTYDHPDSLERPVKPGQFDASTNEPPAEYLRVCPGSTTATMPVPFEALLPYVIMTGMFAVSGTGLAVIKTWQNEGKRPRYSVDQWDKQSMMHPKRDVMDRDRRLTGSLRGQTDKAVAPPGFELNNPWKLESRFL